MCHSVPTFSSSLLLFTGLCHLAHGWLCLVWSGTCRLQSHHGHPPTWPLPSLLGLATPLLLSAFPAAGLRHLGCRRWEHPSLAVAWLPLAPLSGANSEKPSWAVLSNVTSSILGFLSPFLSHRRIYFLQSVYITACKSLVASLIFLALATSSIGISALVQAEVLSVLFHCIPKP